MALTFGVDYILETFAAQEGLTLITDGIDDVCFGYVVSADKTFSQVLRELSAPYNFQVIDGETIRLVRRAVNDDLTIDLDVSEADCIRRAGQAVIAFSRAEPSTLPREVEIQYLDFDRDYARTSQVARHIAAPTSNAKLSISLDFVITAQQARDLAFDLLYRLWSQQLSLSFEHPNINIEPGDVLQLTASQGTFICLVTSQTINMPMRTNSIQATILLSEKGTTFVPVGETSSSALATDETASWIGVI